MESRKSLLTGASPSFLSQTSPGLTTQYRRSLVIRLSASSISSFGLMASTTCASAVSCGGLISTQLQTPTRGTFNFTGYSTSNFTTNGQPIAGTGIDFADFLL